MIVAKYLTLLSEILYSNCLLCIVAQQRKCS